jgi:hypothetical protein
MRFPHLAHRSAAAHKLHSTPQQDRMNLIPGKGATSSRLPGPFSLFLPGSCPNNRNRCIVLTLKWDQRFESAFLQRRVRKLSVPPSLPARHLASPVTVTTPGVAHVSAVKTVAVLP